MIDAKESSRHRRYCYLSHSFQFLAHQLPETQHSLGVTPTLTRPCPGHRATASCTLHSDDLKALSWLPSRRAGQWFCLNISRLGDEEAQVLTCLHTCDPLNFLVISLR